jgi:hypothetical protein
MAVLTTDHECCTMTAASAIIRATKPTTEPS